jgi:hypothetical protein
MRSPISIEIKAAVLKDERNFGPNCALVAFEKELELGVQASAGEYNAFPGESVSSGALVIVDRWHRMGR